MIPQNTPVTEWYSGKTVFITGGTGFMGKVLVEKLLYACPEIRRIYLLLRVKRGRTPQQRIEDMWKSPVRMYYKDISNINKFIYFTNDSILFRLF